LGNKAIVFNYLHFIFAPLQQRLPNRLNLGKLKPASFVSTP
jgi:hypothetical protein